jgi:serine/threonine protein kinase
MAPEVVLKQPYNEKADIFSLGCCIYEVSVLSGTPHGHAEALREADHLTRCCIASYEWVARDAVDGCHWQ